MTEETGIYKALRVWGEEWQDGGFEDTGEHLSESVIYKLAEPGGLQNADQKDVEHLSLCPLCQETWVGWLESLEILHDENDSSGERLLSAGFLKAASSSLFNDPVTLESACGMFELSVFPDLDDPGRALVTLELKAEEHKYNRKYCSVRDGRGMLLLKGIFDDGRLAGRVDNISSLDLKTWTVVVGGG